MIGRRSRNLSRPEGTRRPRPPSLRPWADRRILCYPDKDRKPRRKPLRKLRDLRGSTMACRNLGIRAGSLIHAEFLAGETWFNGGLKGNSGAFPKPVCGRRVSRKSDLPLSSFVRIGRIVGITVRRRGHGYLLPMIGVPCGNASPVTGGISGKVLLSSCET
jgi:hypothetical protein